MTKTTIVPTSEIKADPKQPRQEFSPFHLARLEKSIKDKGVLVPLAVEKQNGHYLLIDGERRYRCAISLGIKELPVKIYETMDGAERLFLRFHIQEQQESWNLFDKARAIVEIQEVLQLPTTELAEALGLSVSTVSKYLSIIRLSKRSQYVINEEKIPFKFIESIGVIKGKIQDNKLSNDLELFLLERIRKNKLIKVFDLRAISRVLTEKPKEESKKIVNWILSHPEYTLDELYDFSEVAEKELTRSLLSYLYMAKVKLNRIKERDLFKYISEEDIHRLQIIIGDLKKTISNGRD